MPIRTADQARSAMIAAVELRGSAIRTDAGEPLIDVIDAVAIESERSGVIADYLRRINSLAGWRSVVSDTAFKQQLADAYGIGFDRTTADFLRSINAPADSISDVEALIARDLDDYTASFGRPRRAATFATAIVRLTLASSDPYFLARGAVLRRGASTEILYDTTEKIEISTPARDPSTGDYYVDVGARCRTAGRVGNAVRGSINTSVGTLQNVVGLANITPADGGADRESNIELIGALALILSGTNINTEQGLLNFVKAQPGVSDALLVKPGDPLMLRSSAGAVDVFVIGSQAVTAQALAVVRVAGESYTLPMQPVYGISSVVDDSLNAYFFGGGFEFVQDTGPSSLSSRAHAQIVWDQPPPTGVGPAVDARMTVVYTYDALVRDIQRRIDDDPQKDVPASSILIRLATLVGVSVGLTVVPIAGLEGLGLTLQNVQLAVEAALRSYFASLKLGQQADFSDAIVAAAETTIDGVEVVDRLDGFAIGKVETPLSFDNLEIAPNEYLRLDTIAFGS